MDEILKQKIGAEKSQALLVKGRRRMTTSGNIVVDAKQKPSDLKDMQYLGVPIDKGQTFIRLFHLTQQNAKAVSAHRKKTQQDDTHQGVDTTGTEVCIGRLETHLPIQCKMLPKTV